MPDVIDINEITKESYSLLTHRMPQFVTFSIAHLYDRLLFAMPVDIGRVSDVKAMMEAVLYQYGDPECPLDYEAMGVIAGTRERLRENLDKCALNPDEAHSRIMGDLVSALKAIADAVIAALSEFNIPAVSDVGAVYRFHSIKNGSIAMEILDYEQLMTVGGF